MSAPHSPLTSASSSCSVCHEPAKLVYQCRRCNLVRHYCSSYTCQSSDWDRHQEDCSSVSAGLEFMEDTVIRHVSGGTTWTRTRKISLATPDSIEAFNKAAGPQGLRTPSPTTDDSEGEGDTSLRGRKLGSAMDVLSEDGEDQEGAEEDRATPLSAPLSASASMSPVTIGGPLRLSRTSDSIKDADLTPMHLLEREINRFESDINLRKEVKNSLKSRRSSLTLAFNSIKLKLKKTSNDLESDSVSSSRSTLTDSRSTLSESRSVTSKNSLAVSESSSSTLQVPFFVKGQGSKDRFELQRARSNSLIDLSKITPIQSPQIPSYKEGILYVHFLQVNPMILLKSSSQSSSFSFQLKSSGSSSSIILNSAGQPLPPAQPLLSIEEVRKVAVKYWVVLDEFFLYAYENSLDTDSPLHEIKLPGCNVVQDKEIPDFFWIEKKGYPLAYVLPDEQENIFESESFVSQLKKVCGIYQKKEPEPAPALGSALLQGSRSFKSSKSFLTPGDTTFNRELSQLASNYEKLLAVDSPAPRSLTLTVPTMEITPAPLPPTPNTLAGYMAEAQKNKKTILVRQDSQTRIIPGEKPSPKALLNKTLSPKEAEKYKEGAALTNDAYNALPLAQGKSVVLAYHVGEGGIIDHSMVAAGTIDLLIERLADETHPDSSYVDIFLLGYRYLVSASVLLDKLITRFNVIPPPNATPDQMQYYNKYANVIKVRVLSVLKKWIDSHWTDFEYNKQALEALRGFLSQLQQDDEKSIAHLGERLKGVVAEKEEHARLARVHFAEQEAKENLTKKKSHVEFTILDAKEFAHQLTLVDHEKFLAIQPSEFVIRLWEGAGPQTRNLTKMITWSNRISYFTATEICIQPDVKKRARLLESFIKVAKECRRVQNFNSLMAILSGLNNSSVRRLAKTWALVNPKSMKDLQALEDLMSGAHNFGKYREALTEIENEEHSGPCIPFLGLVLRDLTFLNDGNPKKFQGDLYNFTKLRRIAENVFSLLSFQNETYSFRTTRVSVSVREYLQNPYSITDGDALYNCSLLCEPRVDGDASPQPIRLIEKWTKEAHKSQKGSKSMIMSGISG